MTRRRNDEGMGDEGRGGGVAPGGWKMYIPVFPSFRVAFIRLRGKSSSIKVMSDSGSGYRHNARRVLHFTFYR